MAVNGNTVSRGLKSTEKGKGLPRGALQQKRKLSKPELKLAEKVCNLKTFAAIYYPLFCLILSCFYNALPINLNFLFLTFAYCNFQLRVQDNLLLVDFGILQVMVGCFMAFKTIINGLPSQKGKTLCAK